MTKLPYLVECQSTYPFFETIAGFDIEAAATRYASECAETNPNFHYRVRKGSKTIVVHQAVA